jgi:lipoprotein-anchoring transpeptidase ErfK/SrfK
LRTRQIQLWKRGEADWDAPEVVRWEEPDLLILDADGNEARRCRVGVNERYWGWRGLIEITWGRETADHIRGVYKP